MTETLVLHYKSNLVVLYQWLLRLSTSPGNVTEVMSHSAFKGSSRIHDTDNTAIPQIANSENFILL